MPDADKCRELAAECLAWAKTVSDPNLRAALTLAAEKWREHAESPRSTRAFLQERSVDYNEIQTRIGRALQTEFELPKNLPHRLFTLLMQLNE
jgi:hypothetical protein